MDDTLQSTVTPLSRSVWSSMAVMSLRPYRLCMRMGRFLLPCVMVTDAGSCSSCTFPSSSGPFFGVEVRLGPVGFIPLCEAAVAVSEVLPDDNSGKPRSSCFWEGVTDSSGTVCVDRTSETSGPVTVSPYRIHGYGLRDCRCVALHK